MDRYRIARFSVALGETRAFLWWLLLLRYIVQKSKAAESIVNEEELAEVLLHREAAKADFHLCLGNE